MQASADRDVGMTGDQRGDQRQQRVEVRRQIDVHVGEHRGVRRGPGRLQRPAAALLRQMTCPDIVEFEGELVGNAGGAVGRGVVRNGDPKGQRNTRREVVVQSNDRPAQFSFLVVHGDDDVQREGCAPSRSAAAGGKWVMGVTGEAVRAH